MSATLLVGSDPDGPVDWVSLLANPELIRAAFGHFVPSLAEVRVRDLLIGSDGPTIHLGFDLAEIPANPPDKWAQAQVNRVQLRLFGFDATQLNTGGVDWRSPAAVTLTKEDGGIRLRLVGANLYLDALVGQIYVDQVNPYRAEQD
jgi:hypothetical protein